MSITSKEVKVYYPKESAPRGTRFFEHPESWDDRKEYYELAAVVELDKVTEGEDPIITLETTYMRTQNDVGAKEGVKEKIDRFRSSATGDVFVLDGTPYEVAGIGFDEITERKNGENSGIPIGS